MFRRLKYILLTSCAFGLFVTIFFHFWNQGLNASHRPTFRESLKRNVSRQLALNQQSHIIPSTVNPIPPEEVLQQMSHTDVQSFYHSYINSPQVICNRVERMGKLSDGGWELCDDVLYRPISGDCLVYSYGIKFDFSYDDDMALYGCEVHSFDPSMKVDPHLHKDHVYFHTSGVGGKNETISPEFDPWQLYTIGSHRKMLQHTADQRQLDIVKMDVEGHELASLMTALDDGSLFDVRQLAFETHVGEGNYDPSKEEYLKFLALVRKVYEKGFRIYLTHRNYQWSAFESKLSKGKTRAHCHEIHTVNINLRNQVNADGSVVSKSSISNEKRLERHKKQMELMSEEKTWYTQFKAKKH